MAAFKTRKAVFTGNVFNQIVRSIPRPPGVGRRLPIPAITLACLLFISLLPSWSFAQIALYWDFDHGALNLANTTVTSSQITLGPRTDIYLSRWIHFRATGMLGLAPEFRISDAHVAGSSLTSDHRYVYSYDQQDWEFFDNGLNSGGYYRFWNDAGFSSDTVWIAYALPYPLSATDDHVDQVKLSPWVSPTLSADANYVIGLSNDGTLVDLGRPVPQHNIYAYKIADDSVAGPKQVVVLTTGNHPNETTGTYVFQGLVDFLLSDDPHAAALRRAADFFVYPESNPDGRWAGHARTNPENPLTDHNRYWNNPVGFTDITVVTTAMKADTNSQADWFFDFHSYNQPTNYGIWMYPEHVSSTFTQGLVSREPQIQIMTATVSDDGPGVARHWAHLPEGLSAEYTFTPEAGFIDDWQPQRLFLLGTNFGLALYDAIVLGSCQDVPTSGVQIFDDSFDAGTSGFLWELWTTSDDYTADFAFDYSIHGIPPAPNSAGTTTGLKFTVNNNDAVEGTEAVSAYPIGQSFTDDYILKFDMWINYNGGAFGGTGSTEFMNVGINHAGSKVNWELNPASDGYSFAVTGEGGAQRDYRAYEGTIEYTDVYAAGSQNGSSSYYTSLFPNPEYETPGSPGKHWVEVEIEQRDDTIIWRLNDTLIATVAGVTTTSGNIMLGYMDVYASVADPAEDNFIIYDNVRVEQLPESDCNGNGITDLCETITGGDYDANGYVDLDDYAAMADCAAGPGYSPAPAKESCALICLDAFDFDADSDIDLRDFAELQSLIATP